MELPVAHALVEDRPGTRDGQYGRAQTGRDDAALGASLRGRAPPGRAAAGVVIVTGDGRTGGALVKHPGVDKIAFTGSTAVGKSIQRELAGTGKRLTLEARRQGGERDLRRRRARPGRRGNRQRDLLQPGARVCCAGSRLLVQESIYEPLIGKLKRRLATLRVGDPLDKNTDVGAINSRQQLDKITELVASGEEEGPTSTSRPAACPRRATGSCRPSSRTSRRATGSRRRRSSGPCSPCSPSGRLTKQSRRRTTRLRARRRRVLTEKARASSRWPSSCGRASSGRTPTTASTPLRPRWLQGVGLGREVGATGSRPTWCPIEQAPRPEDVQALHRRRSAVRVGPHVRGGRRRERRPRIEEGRARCGSRRALGLPQVGGADGVQPRAGGLPDRRDARGLRRSSPTLYGARRGGALDRPSRLVRGLGRQAAKVLGSSNPVAGPYFNFTVPEPTASSACSRLRSRPSRGSCRGSHR